LNIGRDLGNCCFIHWTNLWVQCVPVLGSWVRSSKFSCVVLPPVGSWVDCVTSLRLNFLYEMSIMLPYLNLTVTVRINDNKGLKEYDLFFQLRTEGWGGFMTCLGLFSSLWHSWAQNLGFQIPRGMFFPAVPKRSLFQKSRKCKL